MAIAAVDGRRRWWCRCRRGLSELALEGEFFGDVRTGGRVCGTVGRRGLALIWAAGYPAERGGTRAVTRPRSYGGDGSSLCVCYRVRICGILCLLTPESRIPLPVVCYCSQSTKPAVVDEALPRCVRQHPSFCTTRSSLFHEFSHKNHPHSCQPPFHRPISTNTDMPRHAPRGQPSEVAIYGQIVDLSDGRSRIREV